MKKIFTLFGFLLMVTLLYSCNSQTHKKEFKSPAGYDFNKPVLKKLPLGLDEISGIDYYEKDSSLFAITDEKGVIYKITTQNKSGKWKFSSGADFEDLVRMDSTFYILKSNGDIVKVIFEEGEAKTETFTFPFGDNNEFEILYKDYNNNHLVLICKDCESDKKKVLTTYRFNTNNNQYTDSSFTIDIARAASLAGIPKMKFKPSAAAINPANKQLYIISSINKMILICEAGGTIKEVVSINPDYFKQPEGMTFTPGGDMVVSNEFAQKGTANLLYFKYHPE